MNPTGCRCRISMIRNSYQGATLFPGIERHFQDMFLGHGPIHCEILFCFHTCYHMYRYTYIFNKHIYTYIYISYLYTYSYYTCHMVKLLVLLVKKSCVRIEVGPMTVWPKKRCPDVVHDVIGFQPREKWSRNHKEHLMHFSLRGCIYIYTRYICKDSVSVYI